MPSAPFSFGQRIKGGGKEAVVRLDRVLTDDETGQLTEAIKTCPASNLSVEFGCFQDSACEAVAQGLRGNKSITYVFLHASRSFQNKCSDEFPADLFFGKGIPDQVYNISISHILNISSTEKLVEYWLLESSIQSLSIRSCPIQDEGAKALAGYLKNDASVLHLTLIGCGIGDDGLDALTSPLACHQTIKNLTFTDNNVSEDSVEKLLFAILENPESNLNDPEVYLKGGNVNWRGDTARASSALADSTTSALNATITAIKNGETDLMAFDLEWRMLNSTQLANLADALLGARTQLHSLNLLGNYHEGDAADKLSLFIASCPSLKEIALSGVSGLDEHVFLQYMTALEECPSKVTRLNLSFNDISDRSAQALSKAIVRFPLEELILKEAEISDKGMALITEALGSIRSLRNVVAEGALPEAIASRIAANSTVKSKSGRAVAKPSSLIRRIACFTSSSIFRPSNAVVATGKAQMPFCFQGMPQVNDFDGKAYGPEMWGLTLEQLEMMVGKYANMWPFLPTKKDNNGIRTARDFVAEYVLPRTSGKGMGIALLLNRTKPLEAQTMVTHAWDESIESMVGALRQYEQRSPENRGPYWICFAANYQNEDGAGPSIADQLGPNPEGGPFATVLRACKDKSGKMCAVVTQSCDIYTRMWCIYEQFVALQIGVPVEAAQRQGTPEVGVQISQNALIEFSAKPVHSEHARCGRPGTEMNSDEKAIREAIGNLKGGFRFIDLTIEKLRLHALVTASILEGGIDSTKEYVDRITRKHHVVSATLERLRREDLDPKLQSAIARLEHQYSSLPTHCK